MKINREAVENSRLYNFLKKYWIPILAVIVIITVIASSVGIYKEEVLHIDPDVKYEEGDRLYFSASALDTLNPIASRSQDTYYISKLIYDSLFDYTDEFNVTGELADSYEVDTEKAKIDITLKTGIKWHNGDSLTARDVRFTVSAIKAYGSKSLYYEKASKIRSVQVTGDLKLTIYFKDDDDCALDNLTFPILPSREYSSAGRLIRDISDFKPVGTGKYVYESYDHLKKLKLTPNQSYFGQKALKAVDIVILPEKELASNMMEINAVTCYTDDSSDRYSLVTDKNFKLYDMVSNDVEFIVFNQEKELFKEKSARQAVGYAIDTKNVLEKGYMGDGILADNIYYPDFMGVPDTLSYYGKDKDKASELLKEIGYEDRDLNGKIEDNDGKDVKITLLVNSDNAVRSAAAKLIAKELTGVGFSVTVDSKNWEDYIKAIEDGDYDILITGYDMEASYDLRDFFNGNAPWKYENEELLAAAAELERLHDSQGYISAYEELKSMMLDELPYYTLCYRKMGLVGVEHFETQKLPTFDDIYKNCDTWTWKRVKEDQTDSKRAAEE